MTNEQAISVLKSLIRYYNDSNEEDCYVGFDSEDNEALNIAIQALEQQQDKVIHNHPCEDCYYNDGEVHAECVICDKGESEDKE